MTATNIETTATNLAAIAERAARMATPKHANVGWYAELLAQWQPKLMGAKPTAEQLSVPLYWGYRAGLEALHISMCLRTEGCTVQQFCTAGSCGPANNKRRDVTSHRKLATVTVDGKPYAYKLVMTPKGRDALKAGIAKASEPAPEPKAKKATAAKATTKAKGAVKAKPATKRPSKAKNTPAATPTAPEAVPAEQVPATAPDQHTTA